jgi:hypothetical protein
MTAQIVLLNNMSVSYRLSSQDQLEVAKTREKSEKHRTKADILCGTRAIPIGGSWGE